MDVLQFGTEVPDELEKGRAIDLAAKPCGVILVVQGRAYTDFETLLPVECKRLPTPKGKDRDEREYVYSAHSSTGGIQRFKAGLHGGSHKLAAIIAYMQEGETILWQERVSAWIRDLAERLPLSWSLDDLLHQSVSSIVGVTRLRSLHNRGANVDPIALEHLWLAMN
jgi:hypothetical protein